MISDLSLPTCFSKSKKYVFQDTKKKKKNIVQTVKGDEEKTQATEDDKINWFHIVFWQLLGVCLPTFDVYSDIAFSISNIMQLYPVENDHKIPLDGNCALKENVNQSYCQLSYPEQCK